MSSQAALEAVEIRQKAREAWRNSARCIGRAMWEGLELLDARGACGHDEIFEACLRHLHYSTNEGRIRSTITVFDPVPRGQRGIRIWNSQLVRYAGYPLGDGEVLGDPAQLELTRRLRDLGWTPPSQPSAFDILPLAIEVPSLGVKLFEIPRKSVFEVRIRHPKYEWFEKLGLRWHALPAIADMALVFDDWKFSAAPFSGHYMVTEIAVRNFGDRERYNMLPAIAEGLGLSTRDRTSFWRDRALVELCAAVMYSFKEAGVAMVDHHTAAQQFSSFVQKEESLGRSVPGDWSWLVPPMAGSTMDLYHRGYDPSRPEPAFKYQKAAWEQAVAGASIAAGKCPFHSGRG
ncbi:nitric oxide synthase oxygenase [Pelagicoccus sp. SDUM812005]|uniref:nitric oxide synthase oxygenase n=1 Tax=Pelagicoccus sp. SDUM812005 TaxID=3041257 RepID=UPI00280E581B|nr:nitric oxide synthase oxygenase [Pelagicoccus sp. SDUM812005]MDQ8182609.1 nitric oxide synthase oxygenase [Pelagicoccus sp. SDUM812005]